MKRAPEFALIYGTITVATCLFGASASRSVGASAPASRAMSIVAPTSSREALEADAYCYLEEVAISCGDALARSASGAGPLPIFVARRAPD